MTDYRKTYRAVSIEGPTVIYFSTDNKADINGFIEKVADKFETELKDNGVTIIGKPVAFVNVPEITDPQDVTSVTTSVTIYATAFGGIND